MTNKKNRKNKDTNPVDTQVTEQTTEKTSVDPVSEDSQAKEQTTEETSVVPKEEDELNISFVIKNYLVAMGVGIPLEGPEGNLWQTTLFTEINKIVNMQEYSDFKESWVLLLSLVNKNITKEFSEAYIFRFIDDWTKSDEELDGFHQLMMLVTSTCDDNTRAKNLESIDFNKFFNYPFFTERSKNNLLRFYKV